MKLKRGEGLVSEEHSYQTPSGNHKLKARLRFNHKFAHNEDPNVIGSWTRGVQPDYTFSIWPSAYSEQEAEKNELMVHVHFDAKYRVDKLPGFIKGEAEDDEAINDIDVEDQRRTAPKYEDLLKMHAYRDAIQRTGGAYVLYPGNKESNQEPYKSFYHEILPGLGAFAIRPGKDGQATGIDGLTNFLEKIIEHLCNRTTAYEETRYHSGETRRLHEGTEIKYGSPQLPERDPLFAESVALPPEEQRVVVGWFDSDSQLEWTNNQGIAIVRLGKRAGSFHVPPGLADARHLLLRTRGEAAPGLWKLTEQGFKVYTGAELASSREYRSSRSNPDSIYAVFKVEPDPTWANHHWDNERLIEAIAEFESEKRNKPVVTPWSPVPLSPAH